MTCKHFSRAVALCPSPRRGAGSRLAKNFTGTQGRGIARRRRAGTPVAWALMGKAISTMYPELDVSSSPAAACQRHARREGRERLRWHRRAQRHLAAAKGIDPYKKPTENVMGLLNLHDSNPDALHIVNKASALRPRPDQGKEDAHPHLHVCHRR